MAKKHKGGKKLKVMGAHLGKHKGGHKKRGRKHGKKR
jgi:hypothetical protein